MPKAEGAWLLTQKTSAAILSGDGNNVYSPACIYEGLRAARMGADGGTAAELDALLDTDGAEGDWLGLSRVDGWSYGDYKAHLAAGIWLDGKTRPVEAFVDRCRANEVPIVEADFSEPGAGERIADWIFEQTEGLLAPVIDLEPSTLACIACALYLKDAWKFEFDKQATRRESFYAEGGDVDADYMMLEARLAVEDTDFGVLVGCPFSNGASMVFALPNEGSTLGGVLADGSALEAISAFAGEEIDVELHLPKFSCETTVEGMAAVLASAGFSTASMPDLTPMTGMSGTLVSYFHGAKIEIDEIGIEAGAYFAMAVPAGSPPEMLVPSKPRLIVFDRPFLYVVVSRTGQPLFMGAVRAPKADPYSWLPHRLESEKGSEDGWIIEDEEIPGVCRITLEEDGITAPYSITCGVCGLMLHTAFAADYDEGIRKYEGMKRDLGECGRLLDDKAFDAGEWCEVFTGKW